MTRILLTNDDGIHSDGLHKLEEAMKALGDVYVVAPETSDQVNSGPLAGWRDPATGEISVGADPLEKKVPQPDHGPALLSASMRRTRQT